MSAAFVKTFKWDYVGVKPLPGAKIVLELLADWFEDYNGGLRDLMQRS